MTHNDYSDIYFDDSQEKPTVVSKTCEDCKGNGQYYGLAVVESCSKCAGKGYTSDEENASSTEFSWERDVGGSLPSFGPCGHTSSNTKYRMPIDVARLARVGYKHKSPEYFKAASREHTSERSEDREYGKFMTSEERLFGEGSFMKARRDYLNNTK